MLGLQMFNDLAADVRYTGMYERIRKLVTPYDPDVQELAMVLHQAPDFIDVCQQFVHNFTAYGRESGDYWSMPAELLTIRIGDCDCKAILLCALLRNYISPEKVYCAIGMWDVNGSEEGHMWVVTQNADGSDRIIESTVAPDKPVRGSYSVYALFNDKYVFATDRGLNVFDLKPVLV